MQGAKTIRCATSRDAKQKVAGQQRGNAERSRVGPGLHHVGLPRMGAGLIVTGKRLQNEELDGAT